MQDELDRIDRLDINMEDCWCGKGGMYGMCWVGNLVVRAE